jgi:hypothetical protein
MRATFFATTLMFVLGMNAAEAADATLLAETGGFLLGNAHRCGVPVKRVGQAGKVIHDLIVAASYDATEEAGADARFAEVFKASAFPDQRGGFLVPPCKAVITQFERLERWLTITTWAGGWDITRTLRWKNGLG